MFSLSKYKELKARYLNKNIGKEPFRGELFNVNQLGDYAKILAEEQATSMQSKSTYLLDRLNSNDTAITEYNNSILSAPEKYYISPATEWLIDNYYLIEEHIHLARRHFPKSYSKELPALTSGPYKGLPRVYGMAIEYISHTDSQIDHESLDMFFRSYQKLSVLKLGELWAVPIMLRLVLIENLQRIITRLQQDQKDRDKANYWMDKIGKDISEKNPLVNIVSEMSKSEIPLTSAFVSEFYKKLSSQSPSLRLVKNWMDEKLLHEGLTSEELIYIENQNQAADQVSVSHSIKSLRLINSTDWQEFVENISIVEDILKKDPAEVYDKMDFFSRDNYRHAIELFAIRSCLPEKDIADVVIRLSEIAQSEKKDKRFCHVGYYLTDEGIPELIHQLGIRPSFKMKFTGILKKYPLTFYAGSAILLTFLGVASFYGIGKTWGLDIREWQFLILLICFGVFISQFALIVVNWLATLLINPDKLPRLDFSKNIPNDCKTVIVIPALIASKNEINKLVSDLEIHYLSNRANNLFFALLTDFTDSDKATEQEDNELISHIEKK